MTVSDAQLVLGRLLPEPHAGLLSGILFGTKGTLPSQLYDDMVATGTLHIVALSGMNISILAVLISDSLLRFVSRRISSLLTIVVIIGFILFVGPSPTIVRAGIMGSLTLVAVVSGRQSWSLYSLLIAAALMLVFHPPWVLEISFQLSFMATLGLILFGKKTLTVNSKPLHPFLAYIRDELHITLSAQVFTIPLLFLYFRRISFISPAANVLISWAIPLLTVAGLLTVLLGMLSMTVALPLAWVCWLLLEYILGVIGFLGAVPFSGLDMHL